MGYNQEQEQILNAVVVATGTKAPYGNAKTGAIQTQNGLEFRATPNMLAMVRPGASYQIAYVINNFNGKVYNMVKSIKQVDDQTQGVSQQTQPRANGSYQQSGQVKSHQADTQLSIYVCGGLNQAIASQQVNVFDVLSIENATRNLMNAYKATLGAPPGQSANRISTGGPQTQQSSDEFDDSIPF